MRSWLRCFQRYTTPSHDTDAFPARQLFVLALCRICEPIAFMSLFPYSYRMIESFHVTEDESKISIYAGMLITAFAFAEFSTGMIWGRISDRVGRKPVLIMGLVGTSISMICFGFSTNLWSAVIARALGGLLNGNVGVLQTTVAELVTNKAHQPRAYSIMPFVWCLGSIIGPAMGGALAMPCESYPWLFPRGGLFDHYPFLLPNIVCVVILMFGITTGILFIEETHPDKSRKDIGRKTGEYLIEKICGPRSKASDGDKGAQRAVEMEIDHDEQTEHMDPPPCYRTNENSPLLSSTDPESMRTKENRSFGAAFDRQVIFVIIGYGIVAFHSVSFDALMPVIMSEEPSSEPAVLPFKFTGGFGLSTKTIGFMMAVQGVYSMVAQLWLFPIVVRRVGTLKALRSIMVIWPLLYLVVPYLVLLPRSLQSVGIYAALLVKITFHVIAFPATAILLANAAPSKSVLGTINGVAASTACLCRAFGPTVTGSIHAAGLRMGYNGFAWWMGGIVCAIGALEAYCIKDTDSNQTGVSNTEEDPALCEPLFTPAVEEPDSRPDSLVMIDDLDLNNDIKVEYH